MAVTAESIFSEQNCSNPFFVVTGMTQDNIISDELTVSDVKLRLHHHLIEQGFDAVVFYDPVHMIHFYDVRSSFIMQNHFAPTPQQLQAALRRRGGGAPAPAAQPVRSVFARHGSRRRQQAGQQEDTRDYGPVWQMSMGQLFPLRAYELLAELLGLTDVRCAVVFSDTQAMQIESSDLMLARNRAFRALLSNRVENRNIVIFMAEADPRVPLNRILAPSRQASDWANFVDTYILPHLSSETENRLLRIAPPNAAEIRNLLSMLRLQNGLKTDLRQLERISQNLAAYCSQNWCSMSSLYTMLRARMREHPDAVFDLDAAAALTGKSRYRTARETLEGMVGLSELKEHFANLSSQMELTVGEGTEDSSSRFLVRHYSGNIHGHGMNMALVGNPGTGKSTAAGLVGDLYRELGLLPSGKVVTVSGSELTTPEVLREAVLRAIGGVLLIDEAYALMNTYGGQNVLDALVADMGTYIGQFAVILAGYQEPTMRLLNANDGLKRRIPHIIRLADYTAEEMLTIFLRMAGRDTSVDISRLEEPENAAILQNIFHGWVGEAGPGWGNAGEAENLLNTMKENCAARLFRQSLSIPEGSRLVLTLQDIPEKMQTWASSAQQDLQDAYRELESIQGLNSVKRAIYAIARNIQLNGSAVQEPGFYVFQGPPGTGKTMMAERMGYLFQKLGVIRRRVPYVITARKLLEPAAPKRPGEYTDPRTNGLQDALTMSENGILFIDEAHQLADNDEGRPLIRELVPLMEDADFRRRHCIILAGYTTEMERLFALDAGLSSRFPLRNRIKFKNYSAAELRNILEGMAKKDGETADEAFLQRTELALSEYLSVPRANFGNARFMRNEYLPAAKAMRDARIVREKLHVVSQKESLTEEQLSQLTEADRHTLTASDLPRTPVDFAALAGPVDATPPEPLTSQLMAERLFGKEEISDFIRNITESPEPYSGSKNYIISGPVGSGRETAIRTIANVLADHDLIDSKEVHFLHKGTLEAGYVGQTSDKTRQAVTAAQGGTVVLQNPSALLPQSGADISFGPEAVSAFFHAMQQFTETTSFVLMDTEAGMEAFLQAYPACKRDFEKQFALEDLSIDSMQRIFRLQTEALLFDENTEPLVDDFVANWTADRGGLGTGFQSWTNGDEIESLLRKLRSRWSIQNGETRKNRRNVDCPFITSAMFPPNLRKYLRSTREENAEVLNNMNKEIGLTRVKEAIRAIEVRMRLTSPDVVMPGHYCFIGNPGVGKTRMAQKLGNVLRSTNVLKQGLVITRTAREMMEQLQDFDKLLRLARENVLFIDEAHQLADNAAGEAVIKRLLTVLEDTEVMKNTCIVLAGYPREMQRLFDLDAGLRSRFDAADNILYFEDYTADELAQLLVLFGRNAADMPQLSTERRYDLTLPENAPFVDAARQGFAEVLGRKDPNFGNARYVRNLLHDAIGAQMLRLDAQHPDHSPISEEEWAVLLPEDLPPKYRAAPAQQQPSSVHCIPGNALNFTAREPILPENANRSLNQVMQSIFLLQLLDKDGAVIGHGTGFAVTADGYLLTCCHVAKDAARIRARLYYPGMVGGERWFEDCTVLRPIFPDIDMALLKINGATGFVPLPLREASQPPLPSEEILICGYPFGTQLQINNDPNFEPSRFYGTISSIQAAGTDRERVFIDCAAKSGNSGSPVISRTDGRVIGMLDASTTKAHGKLVEEINYFTPIRMALERFVNLNP